MVLHDGARRRRRLPRSRAGRRLRGRGRLRARPTTPQMAAFLRAGSSSDPWSRSRDVPRATPSAIRRRSDRWSGCAGRCASSARASARCTPRASCTATSSRRTCWSRRGARGAARLRPGPRDRVPASAAHDRRRRHARLHGARAGRGAAARPTPATGTASGVMLYEALTGGCRSRARALEVLSAQAASTSRPPPSTLVRGVPEDLDALCARCCARDPDSAPAGAEILRRLRRCGAPEPSAVRRARAPPPAGTRRAVRRARAPSSRAFATRYADREAGHATTVARARRVGHGQERARAPLPRRAADADPRGAVVLAGRCYERESVPYKALDSVVDALSQHLRRLAARRGRGAPAPRRRRPRAPLPGAAAGARR